QYTATAWSGSSLHTEPAAPQVPEPGLPSCCPSPWWCCLQPHEQPPSEIPGQGLHSGGGEVIDPIHREAMGMASKSTSNVITSAGGSSSFAATVVCEPVDLSHAVNSVIHTGPLRSYREPVPEHRHHPKVGRFHPPRRGAQRRQWDREVAGKEQAGLWRDDEPLQQLSLAQGRNGTYPERPKGQAHLGPQDQTPLQVPSGMYAHMNGNGMVHTSGRPRNPSLSPPEGHFTKDSSLFNGHLNGQLNGHCYNRYYNGHLNGSLSGEEDLRPGDLPSSSEGLHRRPRTQTHYPGELLWGQGKGFPPWPGKMGSEGHMYSLGMVESDNFQRTLTEDLETLHKANKITRK
uniref:Uncharacterized protein n=1 Tax=Oncorhynchus mykiss TaxID=8022 RepID=A0A8C7RPY4_ONCMY